MLADTRLGRFSILTPGIIHRPEEARQMLAGCIVLRAELAADTLSIEYLAHHPAFEPVPPGSEAPAYAPAFAMSPNAPPQFVGWKQLAPATPRPASLDPLGPPPAPDRVNRLGYHQLEALAARLGTSLRNIMATDPDSPLAEAHQAEAEAALGFAEAQRVLRPVTP